jgi:hypothetical protein
MHPAATNPYRDRYPGLERGRLSPLISDDYGDSATVSHLLEQ